MAFDFPASPTPGQEFTPPGGPTYVWTPPKWVAKSAVAVSAVPPGGFTGHLLRKTSNVNYATDWNTALFDNGTIVGVGTENIDPLGRGIPAGLRVGAGTPNAWTSIEIAAGSGAGAYPLFCMGTNGVQTFEMNSFAGTDGTALSTIGAAPLLLQVNSARVMTLAATGNVGVGAVAPSYKFDVQDSIATVSARVRTNAVGVGYSADLLLETGNSFNGISQGAIRVISANDGNSEAVMVFGTTSGTQTTAPEKMRLNQFGQLGIGTGLPTAKLHVAGDFKVGETSQPDLYNVGVFSRVIAAGAIGWDFKTVDVTYGNKTPMTFHPNGNVGINNTDPQQALDVTGTIRASAGYIGGNYYGVAATTTTPDGKGFRGIYSDEFFTYHGVRLPHYGIQYAVTDDVAGNVIGSISSYYGLRFFTVGVERMRINEEGQVVIGTGGTGVNPTLLLNGQAAGSVGTIGFQAGGVTKGSIFYHQPTDASYWDADRIRLRDKAGNQILDVDPTGIVSRNPFYFYTQGLERMRLMDTGQFLINNTNLVYSEQFQVSARVSRPGQIAAFYQESSDLDYGGLLIRNQRTAASFATCLQFVCHTAAVVGSITITTAATSYNTTSDERLKENITPAASAGALIDAIEVVAFDWKAQPDLHTSYGVVAQQVAGVYPDIVTPGKGNFEFNEVEPQDLPEGEEQFVPWMVDHSKLVPLLLKEIQELRARVAALEA